MTESFQFGKWTVEAALDDGARLARLTYDSVDLLTTQPADFQPPSRFVGEYETRPVYGYDDCFPTVDACALPGRGVRLRDHGELCWLPWTCDRGPDWLRFEVCCESLGCAFARTMRFCEHALNWEFEASNHGAQPLPFLHVMHALMPLGEVERLELPRFRQAIDEAGGAPIEALDTPAHAARRLLSQPAGNSEMLLLRGLENGECEVGFKRGLRLRILFDSDIFTTLGIWWNHGGYPNEQGCRRVECAFEPIAGPWSSLERCLQQGGAPRIPPGKTETWQVRWEVAR